MYIHLMGRGQAPTQTKSVSVSDKAHSAKMPENVKLTGVEEGTLEEFWLQMKEEDMRPVIEEDGSTPAAKVSVKARKSNWPEERRHLSYIINNLRSEMSERLEKVGLTVFENHHEGDVYGDDPESAIEGYEDGHGVVRYWVVAVAKNTPR